MPNEKILWQGSPNKKAVAISSVMICVVCVALAFGVLMISSVKNYYVFAFILGFAVIVPIVRYFSLRNKVYTITPNAIVVGNKSVYQFRQVFLTKPIVSIFVPVGTIKIYTGDVKITMNRSSRGLPVRAKKIYVALDYLDNAQEVYNLLTKR